MLQRRVRQCTRRNWDNNQDWQNIEEVRNKKTKQTLYFKGDHNDKEEEYNSERENEASETSGTNEINIINPQINNIDSIYEVLDLNPNLPQIGTSDTCLTNIKDAKSHRSKPEKGMGFTAGKLSIGIVMITNQEEKINVDTGAYFTSVGKSYLHTLGPDQEYKFLPIKGIKFLSPSERMKPPGIIDLTLIFPPPS
ncbi:hypothetical protein O181_096247 [Austropuccinia psidii MF-1]|uniref:Uncharacterized protein n=1 Tax=Austropuccinia psidii MF-1 TaxID=1389203 RepID=A0A9Q3J6X0_9BASI|nr:hypothetical protein [Austropuccinia psidii MF-1]